MQAGIDQWFHIIANLVSVGLVYRANDIAKSDDDSTTYAYALNSVAAVIAAAVAYTNKVALDTWLEGMKSGGAWGERPAMDEGKKERCDPTVEECPERMPPQPEL